MKKILLLTSLFISSAYSHNESLINLVDKLTPKESQLVLSKLQSKSTYPLINEGFFTKMGFSMTGAFQWTDHDHFYNSINPAHGASSSRDQAVYQQASLLWQVGSSYRLGILAGLTEQNHNEEITTDIFEEVSLNLNFLHFAFGKQIYLGKHWSMLPVISLGFAEGTSKTINSNDLTKSSYIYKYSGIGLSTSANLSLNYFINKVFSLGLEGGYHYSEISDLKRNALKSINTPKKISYKGPFVGFKISYNL